MTVADGREPDPFSRTVSRSSAATWSAALRVATLVLVIVRNVALIPLYLRHIGLEEYGAWLATGAVLMQLTALDFGLLGAMLQGVAAAYGRKDRRRLEQLIGSGLLAIGGIAVSLAVLSACAAPFVPPLMGLRGEVAHRLAVSIVIVALGNAVQIVAYGLGGLLESFQRTITPGVHNVIGEVVALAVTAWLVVDGFGLYGIVLGSLARAAWSGTGNAVGCWLLLRARFGLHLRWDRPTVRELWRSSVHIFSTQIAAKAKSYLDPFLVGATIGPGAGGVYALTTKAHDMIRMFALTAESALAAGLAHLHGEGTRGRFKQLILALYRVQAAVAGIGMGGVIAFNEPFVRLLMGEDAYAGDVVNVLAAYSGVVFLITAVSYDALFARGEFSALNRIVWIELLVRLPILLVLLKLYGLWTVPAVNGVMHALLLGLPLTWLVLTRLRVSAAELRRLGGELARVFVPLTVLTLAALSLSGLCTSWARLVVGATIYLALGLAAVALLDRSLALVVLRRRGDWV
jgi:O-antigen/teichoic acid export membrane protein